MRPDLLLLEVRSLGVFLEQSFASASFAMVKARKECQNESYYKNTKTLHIPAILFLLFLPLAAAQAEHPQARTSVRPTAEGCVPTLAFLVPAPRTLATALGVECT